MHTPTFEADREIGAMEAVLATLEAVAAVPAAILTEPELRERVELVLRAARGRFMQDGEDSGNAIITALEGMKWALDLDPEGTPEEMRQMLEQWAKA